MISININKQNKLVILKLTGGVKSVDIINAMHSCTLHSDWKDDFDYFIDTLEQTSIIPLAEFNTLIESLLGFNLKKEVKHAHLVRNYFEYGMAKLWKEIVCRHKINFKPFNSKEAAANWLKKDIDAFASNLSTNAQIDIT